MPDLRPYEGHLSREAVAFVVALSKKRQALVLDLADQLAKQLSKIGDFQSVDAVGRSIENIRLDHASREVRITEIMRL